jgi:hypothetical protein
MDEGVIDPPGRQMIVQLQTTNLDDPMTVGWVETGGLCV